MSGENELQKIQRNLRSNEIAYLTGNLHQMELPPSIGCEDTNSKFTPDGNVSHFPGNTFVCHLDQTSQAFAAVKRLQTRLKAGPAGKNFTYLPDTSFHMTVFPALCGDPLGEDGWADGLDRGLGLDEINQIFLERLYNVAAFAQVSVVPTSFHQGFSMRFVGATPADIAKLSDARHVLENLTGIRRPDFREYQFHISIAYLKRWMSKKVAVEHLHYSDQLLAEFRESTPCLNLGPIEFCTFKNMHNFKTLGFVRSKK